MSHDVLVLGASGHAGRAFAGSFSAAGWIVRRFRRGDDPSVAARGSSLIINAMNPPNYHDWARQIPQITELAMTAARASGARVLIPGNVYVFGTSPAPWSGVTPHSPCSRKGKIRAEMEAAWQASGLPVTILRAGDFLDAQGTGLIMDLVTLKSLRKGRITAMGPPDVPRAYAYLPDLARAAAALAARDDLPVYTDIPFSGHNFSITDLQAEITKQTGQRPKISQFPWWTLALTSPVWELAREVKEMRYLYAHPHSLDTHAFAQLLPDFKATPFAQIVAEHLKR